MKRFSPIRWLPPLPLALAALLGAALLVLAYAPFSFGVTCFVAFVPLLTTMQRRAYRAVALFRAGYLFGFAFFLGLLWWIVKLIPDSSITMPWILTPALIILAAYLSLYPALFLLLLGKLGRARPLATLLVAPALWMLLEMARSSTEFGFPWGLVGYGLSRQTSFVQGASLVGVFGLGAFVMTVNVLWSLALATRNVRHKAALFLAGLAVLVGAFLHGRSVIARFDRDRLEDTRVAIVQPNTNLAIKWNAAYRDSIFQTIERLGRQAALSDPELIVYPETAAPVYFRYNPEYRQRLLDLARDIDIPIYLGFLDARYVEPNTPPQVFNSSAIIYPNGEWTQYDKMHLLPFGEAVPYAWKFEFLSRMDFGQANFHPGPRARPLPTRSGANDIGPLICFESIFPDASRRFVREGAGLLVNITNDGWFGETPGPYQHANMAVLRAVENHRYLLRSANTGVSMVVDPVGRVVISMGMGREGVLIHNVRAIMGDDAEWTLYNRIGDGPIALVGFFLVVAGAIIGRRKRPRPAA